MATQVQTMPLPRWESTKAAPQGIVGQIISLFTRPKLFFQRMPQTRHWMWIALLVLGIAGFGASNEGQTATTSSNFQTQNVTASQTAATTSTGATRSFAARTTGSTTRGTTANAPATTTTAATTNTAATTPQATTTTTTTNALVMAALLTASGVLVMWGGQTILLCLVTMLQGYAPDVGRSVQIAVWASLPLALMLVLRQVNFSLGGTGGAVGLSLLTTQWSGYAQLPQLAQKIISVFMSNLSLFWLWNIVLLYFGARYALGGNRLAVVLVMLMWIISAAVVPAIASNPSTTVAPRTVTTATTSTQARTATTPSSTTATSQQGFGGFPGGGFPGGNPPTGGGTTNRNPGG